MFLRNEDLQNTDKFPNVCLNKSYDKFVGL